MNHLSDKNKIQGAIYSDNFDDQQYLLTTHTDRTRDLRISATPYTPNQMNNYSTVPTTNIKSSIGISRAAKAGNIFQTFTNTQTNEDLGRQNLPSRQSIKSISTNSLIRSDQKNHPQAAQKNRQFSYLTKVNSFLNYGPQQKSQSQKMFLPITQKQPEFKNIFKKTTTEALYEDKREEIQSLTRKMFSVYRKQELEKEKRALEFRMRNSLVSKFAETIQRPEEVQFCKDVLLHMKKVHSETKIIPFAIALHNAQNGLEEKLPKKNVQEISSPQLDTATKMVQQFREKANELSKYNQKIKNETTSIRRNKLSLHFKNALDHLKSINYAEDGQLDEDLQKLRDEFFYCVKQNRFEEIQEMVEKYPKLVNMLDRNKMTPLHWTVKRNYISLADFLLQQGAKKDAQDILGRTALHIASKSNYFEMTKLLLKYKINLTIKNKKQLTAIDVSSSDDITNLINKAHRLGVIQQISFNKPSRAIREAEKKLFRAAGDESD
eukprot:403372280